MTQAGQTTASDVLDQTPISPGAASVEANASTPGAPDEKISGKLRALIGREKSAVDLERRAKAKESEIETRLATIAERERRIEEFENLKKTNPLKALELLGLTYDDLTAVRLNDGSLPPDVRIREIEQRLDQEARDREASDRQRAEDEKQRAEQAEREHTEKFQKEIKQFLKDNGSRYEFIEFEQAHDLVYDVIDENYRRTQEAAAEKLREEGGDPSDAIGEVLTIAQAADKVEEHLEKKYLKSRELKKFQALLNVRAEKTDPKPNPNPPSQKPKSLTNHMSAVPSSPARVNRIRTDDERVAAAIAYARGIRP